MNEHGTLSMKCNYGCCEECGNSFFDGHHGRDDKTNEMFCEHPDKTVTFGRYDPEGNWVLGFYFRFKYPPMEFNPQTRMMRYMNKVLHYFVGYRKIADWNIPGPVAWHEPFKPIKLSAPNCAKLSELR